MSASKLNCWEFNNCQNDDCIARRRNVGTICWMVAGTPLEGKTNLTFMDKIQYCAVCSFQDYITSALSDNKAN